MPFIDSSKLYPLKFSPIYATRIWGGSLLSEATGRVVPETGIPIGESLELVDREDIQSVVSNGPLAGATISQLLDHYKTELLGSRWSGKGRFPLIIKFIDAGDRLSLQVHPDEVYCQRHGEGFEAKTKMWYVFASRAGAKVAAGVGSRTTKQQIVSTLSTLDVENYLQSYNSIPGDAYFIPAGILHTIGQGNLIFTIQQNSDTSFRLSDWGRVDEDGHSRELNIAEGLEAIDFRNRITSRIPGVVGEAPHNRKFALVNRCRHFSVDVLKLRNLWRENTNNGTSFHLLTAVNNPIKVGRHSESEAMVDLATGESVLIPACFSNYFIVPQKPGTTNVIRVTL